MDETMSKDEDDLAEARERFKRGQKYQSEANMHFMDDLKFAEGDAYNHYQWPSEYRTNRELEDEPCLTINKTRQHNLQIINDSRQNKPGIGVRAVGNDATFNAAQMIAGIIRYIEYNSNAQTVYDYATSFQVKGGIGYIRLTTDYIDDTSFDQDIFIKPVLNPLTVCMDPEAKELDKSDMNWCFLFENQTREEFDRQRPDLKDAGLGGQSSLGADEMDSWYTDVTVRKAEYFRVVFEDDELIAYVNKKGKTTDMIPLSLIPKQIRSEILADPETRRRPIRRRKVECLYIIGQKIIERKEWAGSKIPIVPVIGEEIVIEGRLDRKGHTRALLDPQRMYNYWSSAAVLYGALQTKTPWVGAAQAIEGLENYWNTANRINHAILPYNAYNDDGQPLPPPQRTEPPTPAPVALAGMQTASTEMMLVSGQYEAGMGAQGNERSAKAIDKRQRQGENATYHYIDNLAIAIRSLGKQILELIPKIFDSERIISIMAEDGTTLAVKIDPSLAQAYKLEAAENAEDAVRILNPKVGRYEVQIDVGPAFGTKREEAFNAFTLILTQAPHLVPIIGDILFKAGDFPMANEAAERLRRLVPKEALGIGPSQNEQALMGQIEQLKAVLGEMLNELAKNEVELKNKAQEIGVKDYAAHTERLKVVGDHTQGIFKIREIVEELANAIIKEQNVAKETGKPVQKKPVMNLIPSLAGAAGNA